MICADTNVYVHFLRSQTTKNPIAKIFERALVEKQLLMSPFVLSELLSSPKLPHKLELLLLRLPRIEIDAGFFERAGLLRKKIYSRGQGITMVDIYIAQTCIDAAIPLLTDDQDFHVVAKASDLKLISE